MQWRDALNDVEMLASTDVSADIVGVEYDSRRVGRNSAFVAMRGGTADGNSYIDAAIAQGASAILTDSADQYWQLLRAHPETGLACVQNGRRALAELSAAVFGHPERKLAVSAVTGTNGKTTTAYLLEQMLRSARRKCVLIGTIETHVCDEVRESPHTTPEASDILRIFADGVAARATEAVMEMSSHALHQERVWKIPVDVAIFTNLTQDHLDYHGTMEQYFAAKARLFEGVGAAPPRIAVTNLDDPFGDAIVEAFRGHQVMTYGIEAPSAAYRASEICYRNSGTSFVLTTPAGSAQIDSPLVGRVNVSNLVAAICAAMARGMTLDETAKAIPELQAVPGRFQVVRGSAEAGFSVVVDYAHTDDALRNLCGLGRDLIRSNSGRVITVFGCGGDRDRSKRPRMGLAAGQGSDLVVLTSDNPRSEDPDAIVQEALAGVRQTGTACIVEPDRKSAIEAAIRSARSGDIVLIAGKGHEKFQILGRDTIPFDDVAVAADVLKRMCV